MSESVMLNYAMHAHAQSKVFDRYMGFTLAHEISQKLEFAAMDTAFQLLESVASRHFIELHGITVTRDEEDELDIMTLSSGHVVCRGFDHEQPPGKLCRTYHQQTASTVKSTVDILIEELERVTSSSDITFS